ncbi:hypothetical protein TRIP_B270004 [uncultured Desulfatiglans sp.]|nr:hypothetical protein TRIP_B270004 [uncultured Desulfatiglans sp.]
MRKFFIKSIYLGILSAILTIFVTPQRAINQSQLSQLQYGYPFQFILEDRSRLNPELFPQRYYCCNPLEYKIEFIWIKFILSCMFFTFIYYLILYAIYYYHKFYFTIKNNKFVQIL